MVASSLSPTTLLLDALLGGGARRPGLVFREVRLASLDAFVADAATHGNAAWREIVAFTMQEWDDGSVKGWARVVWITPDIFVTRCDTCGYRMLFRSTVDAATGMGFRSPWSLTAGDSLDLDIYARQHPLQTTRAEGRQVMDAMLCHLAHDSSFGYLRVNKLDRIVRDYVQPSTRGLRELVGTAPSSPRTIKIWNDSVDGSLFSENEEHAIVTNCHEDVCLELSAQMCGRAFFAALRENWGPRKLTLAGCYFFEDAAYDEFLQALSLSHDLQDLSVDELPSKRHLMALVNALPPGLVNLSIPVVVPKSFLDGVPFSLGEWEAIWTAVGAHPSLKTVATTAHEWTWGRGGRLPQGELVRRSTVMGRCLRASATLTSVSQHPHDKGWGYDEAAFQKEMVPKFFENLLRPRIKAILREPSCSARQVLFASTLMDLHSIQHLALIYPLLCENLEVWLPLVASGGPDGQCRQKKKSTAFPGGAAQLRKKKRATAPGAAAPPRKKRRAATPGWGLPESPVDLAVATNDMFVLLLYFFFAIGAFHICVASRATTSLSFAVASSFSFAVVSYFVVLSFFDAEIPYPHRHRQRLRYRYR